jgi:pimeloyl-ACP methyl ester carboxylesterase
MRNTQLNCFISLTLGLFSSLSIAQVGTAPLAPCHLKDIPDLVSCGTLAVAESSGDEASKTIGIHYSVLPAIKASFPDEAVLVIAGGPGQSAIEHAAYFNRLLSGVRQQRDILVVDQRGTGASHKLQCESSESADPLQFLDSNYDLGEEVKRCQDELATDLNNYTSLPALQDFEAIRKHLGYKKLHLFGVSYGTRMTQLYMKHYPEVLATVTMDGVVPMSQNVLAVGNSVDRAMRLLFEQCEQQPQCEQEYPELKQDFTKLLASLGQTWVKSVKHPVSAQGSTLRLNRSKFLGLFRLALYSPQTRALLPYTIHQLSVGDAQAVLGLMSLTLDNDDIAMGMHSAVVCAEDWPRLTDSERTRINSSVIGKDMLTGLDALCSVWQLKAADASFSEELNSDIPTLLLSGFFDPATPPEWADVLVNSLSNGRHIVAPYATHGVASQTCADQIVEQFISGVLPEELDASCIEKGVERRFFINANGSLNGQSPESIQGLEHD